ncbi:MAG: type II toxin-antitoxin system RelE/ParE family toxin [Bacillota bacterium]|nr:type II toxin-antitoxin system RelE/ParE family toxin [Bacillota bacterium]
MPTILYRTKTLEKACTDYSKANKKYGSEMADKIHQRVDEIMAADSVAILLKFKIGRCHKLKGDRKEEYAMDLIHPFRLVFIQIEGEIELVKIIEIENYH